MKRSITLCLTVFLLWLLLFQLQKPLFLLVYQGSLSQVLSVGYHGLVLDLGMAAYLSIVPVLLMAVRPWLPSKVLNVVHRCYFIIAGAAFALSFVTNLALYHYWHFPLDATPLFYLMSSPADAMASAPWWMELLLLLSVVLLAVAVARLFQWTYRKFEPLPPFTIKGTLVHVLLLGLLIIPMRGGVTVSTNNTGKAYFSENQLLNHAAVNPLFSFMESVSRQTDFASQYRYMNTHEAKAALQQMNGNARFTDSLSVGERLIRPDVARPDVYIILMESFSDTLMHARGATPRLNRLAHEGVYFSNFFANSFRTDRGMLSVLMGFPSPATVSLMKFPRKTASMPSIAASLKQAGWDCHYYYGGDADFTNMRSFLVNQGFTKITEDVDFPVSQRLSKWGVPDHLLFQRVNADLRQPTRRPMFRVIQTSSSHEPFDVPFHRLKNERLNAFAYSDSCIGAFIDSLKARPALWKRSLVVLVPDHLGAWPEHIDDFKPWRFHVPMIWTGGALSRSKTVSTYGSQQDIAATLLAQLQRPHRHFPFSKNLFDARTPHYGIFMMYDGIGVASPSGTLIYDNQRRQPVYQQGNTKDFDRYVKAYIQHLFDYIAHL